MASFLEQLNLLVAFGLFACMKLIAGLPDFFAITKPGADNIFLSNSLTCDRSSTVAPISALSDIDKPTGIDWDSVNEKLYFVDRANKQISRSDIDGGNVEHMVTNVNQPYALALDITNRVVYWTQVRGPQGTQYINMDGTGQGNVPGSDTGASEAKALVVGAITGYIYVAYTNQPQLRVYSKDGMNAVTLISLDDDISDPRGLYVEESRALYWSDAGLNKIERNDWTASGSTRTVIFQGASSVNEPQGLDGYKGYIYFIDTGSVDDVVFRIPLQGSGYIPRPIDVTGDNIKGSADLVFYDEDGGTGEDCLTAEFNFDTAVVDNVCEGDTVTVTLTNNGPVADTVNITTTDGVAIGGLDYDVYNEMVTVNVGATVTVSITILDDTIIEPPETFTLQLLNENGDVITGFDDTITSVSVVILPDLRCKEIEYQQDDFIITANDFRDNVLVSPLTCFKVFRFKRLPIDDIDKLVGVSYDPVEMKLYWVEAQNMRIRRSNLDGTDPEDVVTGINRPYALRLDVVNRIVYWTQLVPARRGIHYIYMDKTRQGLVPNSDFGATAATALAVGNVTGLIYIAYTEGDPQIRRFSLDGTVDETLIAVNDDIDTVGGMYLDENDGKLYWSDNILHKIEIYDIEGSSRSVLFLGTEVNEPLGLCGYKDYMYFIDAKNFYDGYDISRIKLDGSESESTQVLAIADDWGANGAIDLVMYDFGRPQEIVCGPDIYFEEAEIGPVCEGESVCVTIHNVGDRDGIVNVTSSEVLNITLSDSIFYYEYLDFTALGGIDFQNKSVEVVIPVNATVTIGYFNVIGDDETENEEELFGITLESNGWDVDLTFNKTANVTIAAVDDAQCSGVGGSVDNSTEYYAVDDITPWIATCDNTFDATEASTTCQDLGFASENPTPIYGFPVTASTVSTFKMYRAFPACDRSDAGSCSGTDRDSVNCPCTRSNEVAINCVQESSPLPEFRFVEGGSVNEGLVEINVYGVWGSICDSDLNDTNAKVICRTMGLPYHAARIEPNYPITSSSEPVIYGDLSCNGDEERIDFCEHTEYPDSCSHSGDVAISCRNFAPFEQDYIRTYDGEINGSILSKRYFRIQEGAVVNFICPLSKGDRDQKGDRVDIYWGLGGNNIGTGDDEVYVDGVELEEHVQLYNPLPEFSEKTGNRLAIMTYTARKEDNLKKLDCRISDEDEYDSVEINDDDRAEIYLLVLPGPAPQTLESTIGKHVWPGGFVGEIHIPIDAYYNSWKIILTFPKNVYRIYAGNFNIATEPCLHKGSCTRSWKTWIIYNTYENRVLSPLQDLHLQFAADTSKLLNRGRGRGLVADVQFYGYNKVFGSRYTPRF